MTKAKFLLFSFCYFLFAISLALYSYSQIDLNLTLSSNNLYQQFQNIMIQLGYFNRLLSTLIFVGLIFLLFTFYFLLLWMVKKNKISHKRIWLLIILTCGILLFSYPAFSHDIFNYMFDARIVTTYHLSPYNFRALDFPHDLWIRFMHWTHRYYPYGPTWIMLTLPFSLLGFGKFTLTLLNFKLLFVFSYLGNILLIKKISAKISPGQQLFNIVFFAFNPLILIESLVSPHNESIMLLFLLLALYQLINSEKRISILTLVVSGSIKFLTFIFLPFFWLWKNNDWARLIKIMTWILLISLIPVVYLREPYPWYFITLIGLIALNLSNELLLLITVGVSLATLLRYTPFLYFGEYTNLVSQIQTWVTVVPILASIIIFSWRKNFLKN